MSTGKSNHTTPATSPKPPCAGSPQSTRRCCSASPPSTCYRPSSRCRWPRKDAHQDPACSLHPRPYLRATRKHNAHSCGGTNSWLTCTAGRVERPAACAWVEGVVAARRGTTTEATRESSRSGFGALKSTGSRRRVPRSASPARATCRPLVSCQLQPAAAPDLGRYRPAAPASPIICTG